MAHYRISEAAQLLGVSDDTVRRWVESSDLVLAVDDAGRQVIAGTDLAARAVELAQAPHDPSSVGRSARNRFVGLVTRVVTDQVIAQVEIQSGQHRVVSLLSAEAVRELGLEVGSLAVAVVKATNVIIETPGGSQ
ncbi:TOBE domain-containing protein [Sanguibacter suarezii]|uniref:TOBE domain-containing protein n=1 Tax=Sanguibacter suarezii TaxID=60921 RepID=UPI0008338D42|nr:TOBE domain-containing protein [Sanguibacter suarezii]